MTEPYYSGFLSMLQNTNGSQAIGGYNLTDILSTVVSGISLDAPGISGYTGGYFYLGNLLIQFSDFSGTSTSTSAVQPNYVSTGNYSVSFPIEYPSLPYIVIISGTSGQNNTENLNIYATLITYTVNGFEAHIGNQSGAFSFLAIGPRPTNTTTAT